MRLFVALDIPDEVRARLSALIERLRLKCRSAKWVRLENVHVTLKFIGDTSLEKLEEIKKALASVKIAAPLPVIFRGVGFFPDAKRPRVFWAGIAAGSELANLAGKVAACLEPLGIEKEQRQFSPHITLAQFKVPVDLQPLQIAIVQEGPLEFGGVKAAEFHLYQSVLKPTGAEYTRLATFGFAEGGQQ